MPDTQLQTELAAIRTGAAIYPITDRAFLRITGPDATRWLNGMVTNNIKDLAPGEGNYNFLLNAQGRIQGDCTIYRDPSETEVVFLLETESSQIAAIEQLLDRFIIMDDVQLAQIFYITFPVEAKNGLLLVGERAAELLTKVVSEFLDKRFERAPSAGTMTPANANGSNLSILTLASQPSPAYELWFPDNQEAGLVSELLLSFGARLLSPEAIEAHRILSAIPKYGIDIHNTETARDLPQETAQTHALHFAKGCYLGQEIVERIRSRGQVHRTFTQFHLTGTLPELPAKLEANGKPAGELTSAMQIGADIVALGYLRREALNETITYPGGTACPTTPHTRLTT